MATRDQQYRVEMESVRIGSVTFRRPAALRTAAFTSWGQVEDEGATMLLIVKADDADHTLLEARSGVTRQSVASGIVAR